MLSVPGTDGIQLFSENFSTYNRYDRLMIKDLDGNILQTYHGQLGNFTTRWFEESGIVIHFETSATYSDCGFDITGYQTGMKNGMTTPSFAHSPIFLNWNIGQSLKVVKISIQQQTLLHGAIMMGMEI